MSILMVLFLSLTMVHANESTTYRLSEKEMEMMDEYSKQNVNTPEFIQLRKEKAETYGLVDYCDENYILEEYFYDEYADAYLMQNGLMILDRYSAGFESSSSFMMLDLKVSQMFSIIAIQIVMDIILPIVYINYRIHTMPFVHKD